MSPGLSSRSLPVLCKCGALNYLPTASLKVKCMCGKFVSIPAPTPETEKPGGGE